MSKIKWTILLHRTFAYWLRSSQNRATVLSVARHWRKDMETPSAKASTLPLRVIILFILLSICMFKLIKVNLNLKKTTRLFSESYILKMAVVTVLCGIQKLCLEITPQPKMSLKRQCSCMQRKTWPL